MAKAKGEMSVSEAGRLGGIKTRDTHGPEFYQAVGREGGRRVQELVRAGKAAEARERESG